MTVVCDDDPLKLFQQLGLIVKHAVVTRSEPVAHSEVEDRQLAVKRTVCRADDASCQGPKSSRSSSST